MSMKIHAGLELDGMPAGGAMSLNELTVGPLGLLATFETHLGLLGAEPAASERVLQYLQCLKACDSEARFYHRSIAADELGTAATLLAWRDAWYLHGWDGGAFAGEHPRLHDLQQVEGVAASVLAPSIGERLARVEQALAIRHPPIASICCSEPLTAWPDRWQRVLARLNARHEEPACPLAGTTMLGQLQAACLATGRGETPAPLQWVEDGSVHVVRADTRLLASQWLAAHIADGIGGTLLVAEQPGMLDDAFAAAGLARTGQGSSSRFRPALQLTALALEALWLPLNVYQLLAFLSHPVCPLPRLVRERLAGALARSPGIGNAEWRAALGALEEIYTRQGWDWPAMREQIVFWLECPRYEEATGAPLAVLEQRLDALVKFLNAQIASSDNSVAASLRAGLQQVMACRRALPALCGPQDSHIGRARLQTLVEQLVGAGTTNPALVREVGAPTCLTRPGAALQQAERVIWWDLAAPALPAAYPWSAAELAALRQAGVNVPGMDAVLERQAQGWLRPLLAARRQLILSLPPAGDELHPLWLMIESLFDPKRPPSIQPVDSLLSSGGPELLSAPCQSLPKERRWWQLPDGVAIPARDVESFSSLEPFLFNPYQWVLRYPAALQPGTILGVSGDMQLLGTLAHHLVESWFTRHDALPASEPQFDDWFASAFDELIVTEGSTLLLPGRRVELESFRARLNQALVELHRQFAAAQVVRVECEPSLDGDFTGGKLAGRADLRVTNASGKQAIIDMKWAGEAKYSGKLASNSQLQLALYGELQHQRSGAWPDLAYFILCSAQLLATDNHFFPNASIVHRNKTLLHEGPANLWQRFLQTWRWRRAQLDSGLIEVALSVDEESDAPEDGMALEALNPRYNDYLALAGWGDMR